MTAEQVNLDDVDYQIDFLEHYGVKGMKWGVRRSQAQLDRAAGRKVTTSSSGGRSSGSSSTTKKTARSQPKPKKLNPAQRAGKALGEKLKKRRETRAANNTLAKLATRSVADLTTDELRAITTRLNLEQQYAKLTTPEKTQAKSKVTTLLNNAKLANEALNTGVGLYNNSRKIMQIATELNKRK